MGTGMAIPSVYRREKEAQMWALEGGRDGDKRTEEDGAWGRGVRGQASGKVWGLPVGGG